ncbi:DUF4235 domain-containing protein [Nonomuraea fastidiosa]|jgi:hypothetical protein|uniref:DUF4235 domain-containing protein n=1 Tax=Nonomuraea TaxID=83681 RepID=UPI0032549C86
MQPVEKAASLGVSLLSGVLAAALFRRAWTLVSGQDEAPDAEDLERGLAEVLVAAAVQGAVFSVVRAAVQRAGAKAAQRRH